MTLTKDKLVDQIRTQMGYPIKESLEIINLLLEEIKLSLEQGNAVVISNFGRWSVCEKKARRGRNPHTGEKMIISARKVVSFKPSGYLRKLVDSGKQGEINSKPDV